MEHFCQTKVRGKLKDGMKRKCATCGRAIELLIDPVYGVSWVPYFPLIHDKEERREKWQRIRAEAQGCPYGKPWRRHAKA